MENRNTPRPENPPTRVGGQPVSDADFNEDEDIKDAANISAEESPSEVRLGGDTGFDQVVGPDEAGLGCGLDQAEEARLGVTDEELAEMRRRPRTPNT